MSFQVSYSIKPDQAKAASEAAQIATGIMLAEWLPIHWHLDSVSHNDERTICSFSVVPHDHEQWRSDD